MPDDLISMTGDGAADWDKFSEIEKNTTADLALVEWEDSRSPTAAWAYVHDLDPPKACLCRSVGYVLTRKNGIISLAANLADVDSDEVQASAVIVIPTRAVRRIVSLKETNDTPHP